MLHAIPMRWLHRTRPGRVELDCILAGLEMGSYLAALSGFGPEHCLHFIAAFSLRSRLSALRPAPEARPGADTLASGPFDSLAPLRLVCGSGPYHYRLWLGDLPLPSAPGEVTLGVTQLGHLEVVASPGPGPASAFAVAGKPRYGKA